MYTEHAVLHVIKRLVNLWEVIKCGRTEIRLECGTQDSLKRAQFVLKYRVIAIAKVLVHCYQRVWYADSEATSGEKSTKPVKSRNIIIARLILCWPNYIKIMNRKANILQNADSQTDNILFTPFVTVLERSATITNPINCCGQCV